MNKSLNYNKSINTLKSLEPDFYIKGLLDCNTLWNELGIPQTDIKNFMEY